MGKRNTSLYMDDNILTMAMDKGINISQFCENCLKGAISENIEEKDKNVVNSEIALEEAKLQKLKAQKQGMEREELRKSAMGIKKDGWVIEIKDKNNKTI